MIDFPSELELAGRIALAFVLGAIVGFEREVNDHPAGLRTHVAIALGACLFAIVSAYGFEEFDVPRDRTVHQVDVTRVASQIVSGMGFLGGGAILKYGPNVRGLTTAASMWVTAAIGLAVAVGSYAIALVTTAAVLLSLVILKLPKRWIDNRLAKDRDTVVIRMAPGKPSADVVSAICSIDGVRVTALHVETTEGGTSVNLQASTDPGKGELSELVAPLAARPDVHSGEVG